jgi:serine/threonine-protein kinase
MLGASCPEIETFEDYLANDLSPERRTDLLAHLDGCQHCGALLDEIQADRDLVDRLGNLPRKAALRVPERLGPYEIERVLGTGGMGVVYQAVQHSPRRRVALKVIRGDPTDPKRIRRFRREVETLARLQHPGIAAIYEAGCTDDGQHYFVMEHIDGAPLDRPADHSAENLADKLELFCQICEAVDHAHKNGVVHRDLKPANVLIDSKGRPKVLDFGLAHLTDPDSTLTTVDSRLASIQGTLPYMSPEQTKARPEEVGPASDIYSLGVVLYEMLTGRRPHDLRNVSTTGSSARHL